MDHPGFKDRLISGRDVVANTDDPRGSIPRPLTENKKGAWSTGSQGHGTHVMGIVLGGGDVLSYGPIDEYNDYREKVLKTGTSMATPFVAGTAGRIFAIDPDLIGAQVLKILELTSLEVPALQFKVLTGGIIDPRSAYELAAANKLRKENKNPEEIAEQLKWSTEEKSRYTGTAGSSRSGPRIIFGKHPGPRRRS